MAVFTAIRGKANSIFVHTFTWASVGGEYTRIRLDGAIHSGSNWPIRRPR